MFEVVARTLGWFGIGVNANASMVGADIFWAQQVSVCCMYVCMYVFMIIISPYR